MASDKDSASLAAPQPVNQERRLAALSAYGILDTPREEAFDAFARLAAYICQTPIAVVNLIDRERQWFKAEVGLGVRETPLDTSICAHAILQPGLFVVPDLRADSRFDCNPLVTSGPGLRFYAGALLQTPDGHAIGTMCVLDTKPRSITEEQGALLQSLAQQVMTQLELRSALAVASKANKYRSRLMAIAGHDLKQPLQVVNLMLSTMQAKVTDTAWHGRLQMALDAIDRMVPDLDRLAIASRIDDDGDIPQIEEFPLSQLFDAIAATWKEHAAHKGLNLRVVNTSVQIVSDPRMLGTLLGNLVGNAIKYTRHGSVLIGCRRLSERVCIHVIDTGIGVAAHRQAAIFEAFHQEDASAEGLGLGLSIVQRSAEALGLKVNVRSVVGKGTTFSLAVPMASSQAGLPFAPH